MRMIAGFALAAVAALALTTAAASAANYDPGSGFHDMDQGDLINTDVVDGKLTITISLHDYDTPMAPDMVGLKRVTPTDLGMYDSLARLPHHMNIASLTSPTATGRDHAFAGARHYVSG